MQAVMEVEHSRFTALLLIALAAFLAGMALGKLEMGRTPGHSRIDWPSTPAHPRSLQP
jgi:hypothetical protein